MIHNSIHQCRYITKAQKQNNIIPNVTPKNVTKVKDFFNIFVHDTESGGVPSFP